MSDAAGSDNNQASNDRVASSQNGTETDAGETDYNMAEQETNQEMHTTRL